MLSEQFFVVPSVKPQVLPAVLTELQGCIMPEAVAPARQAEQHHLPGAGTTIG
jgi:hypothetical protein